MMMIEPAAGAAHCRHGVFDRQKHPVEVYCGLSPPVGQRHLDRHAQNADPGIGHHHVQTSKALLGGFDYCRPALLDTLRPGEERSLRPGAPNLLRHRPTCGIFQVGYDDLSAASHECRRARGADSRCAAGYDRDLGVQLGPWRPPISRAAKIYRRWSIKLCREECAEESRRPVPQIRRAACWARDGAKAAELARFVAIRLPLMAAPLRFSALVLLAIMIRPD